MFERRDTAASFLDAGRCRLGDRGNAFEDAVELFGVNRARAERLAELKQSARSLTGVRASDPKRDRDVIGEGEQLAGRNAKLTLLLGRATVKRDKRLDRRAVALGGRIELVIDLREIFSGQPGDLQGVRDPRGLVDQSLSVLETEAGEDACAKPFQPGTNATRHGREGRLQTGSGHLGTSFDAAELLARRAARALHVALEIADAGFKGDYKAFFISHG
ncbi:hypothetical protein MPLB_2110013 [Mesorhizobium sp. ORS 3324]|nr:hypothetical protein MPLB_2110013 [Mesorhizobium sp. ORS 3324]